VKPGKAGLNGHGQQCLDVSVAVPYEWRVQRLDDAAMIGQHESAPHPRGDHRPFTVASIVAEDEHLCAQAQRLLIHGYTPFSTRRQQPVHERRIVHQAQEKALKAHGHVPGGKGADVRAVDEAVIGI